MGRERELQKGRVIEKESDRKREWQKERVRERKRVIERESGRNRE